MNILANKLFYYAKAEFKTDILTESKAYHITLYNNDYFNKFLNERKYVFDMLTKFANENMQNATYIEINISINPTKEDGSLDIPDIFSSRICWDEYHSSDESNYFRCNGTECILTKEQMIEQFKADLAQSLAILANEYLKQRQDI